jgi:hypothetical protein
VKGVEEVPKLREFCNGGCEKETCELDVAVAKLASFVKNLARGTSRYILERDSDPVDGETYAKIGQHVVALFGLVWPGNITPALLDCELAIRLVEFYVWGVLTAALDDVDGCSTDDIDPELQALVEALDLGSLETGIGHSAG